MLNSLSKTKTKVVRESFDKKFVQATIGTKYKLGLGAKNGNRRRGKLIELMSCTNQLKENFLDAEL